MVQLLCESVGPHRTCGGQMGPAHKARDDGDGRTYGIFGRITSIGGGGGVTLCRLGADGGGGPEGG